MSIRMSSIKEYIRHLHTVHINRLKEDSPMVNVPEGSIKIPLHPHQRAIMAKMEDLEQSLMNGMPVENEIVTSNYGILGDSVGSGKSLMILGHIARLASVKPITKKSCINPQSDSNFFSVRTKEIKDISEAGCLIIVPHTLYRQWADYITKQTNLTNFCIARVSQLDEKFTENIFKSQIVLISNTLARYFMERCANTDICWKRLFIDEADTIHLTGNYSDRMSARFTWLVTASWSNLLYLNANLYFDKGYVNEILNAPDASRYDHLKAHFRSLGVSHHHYFVESKSVKSVNFLRGVLTANHPYRSQVIITCCPNFIRASISLPPLYRKVLWCREPKVNQIIHGAVSTAVRQMLHAGDTKGALEELGLKGQDATSLIDAVTGNLQREVVRLEKTYAFKASLDYATTQAKEAALKSLKDKIDRTNESIKSIKERIQNFETELCPICYEEPSDHLITPCCSRVFCATCLLMSMARNPECPLCRAQIHPSKCAKLIKKGDLSGNEIVATVDPNALTTKNQTLLKLLNDNPTGKFLVFSRYENTFDAIEQTVDEIGVKVRNLKGTKDSIASTLRQFESGKVRCLLLNSQFAGSGLNITAATHVVLLHAMTHEEEKQILGRAYRAGRQGSLEFIKLLNKDEEVYLEE